MPTAQGPCRFGQYRPLLKKVLGELGHDDVLIVSPTSRDGYAGLGEKSQDLVRTGWRALVGADLLRKMLHRTRPYELRQGETDAAYEQGLDTFCAAVEAEHPDHGVRLAAMVDALTRARDRFRAVEARYCRERPLIGVVGEIFCRMNRFSNEDLVRKLEQYGAECWMSDISEWVWYTNHETRRKLVHEGRRLSLPMLGVVIKQHIQRKDEEALLRPFAADFYGYEEPHGIREVLDYAEPYLPDGKVLGEMVLSVGKSVYLYKKGADGIVDISPFSCMNGIASEAVYPALSRDHDRIPIRNFYFDGTARDLDRDVGIFVELALGYMRRKGQRRVFPACFAG
jgi:predicted nucleotide-binding protein (sugar kinase/HSP70/actin superfamily)